MTHHASHDIRRVSPKAREIGAAIGQIKHERRHKTTEGRTGYIGSNADLGGTTWDSGGDPPYPGITLDSSGLTAHNAGGGVTMTIAASDGSVTVLGGSITGADIKTSLGVPRVELTSGGIVAYNSGGVATVQISAADGSLNVNGAGTITGGTIRTSATNPRVVFDNLGIRGFNGTGAQTFSIDTNGNLTVGPSGNHTITGGTIQTSTFDPRVIMDATGIRATSASSSQTVSIGSDGSFLLKTPLATITATGTQVAISSGVFTSTGARVTIDATGIRGYNASGTQEFLLDSTSGLIQATGLIQASPGSTVPWQSTGFFVGGGNLAANSSAEDPTTTNQVLYVNTGSLVDNLISTGGGNPSFEGDTVGAAPAWWSQYNPNAQTYNTYAVQTGWAQDGSKSLRITLNALAANAKVGVISPSIPVSGLSSYGFAAYTNLLSQGAAGCTFQIGIQWFDGSSALISTSVSSTASGLGSHRMTLQVSAPSNAVSAKLIVYVIGPASASSADFYFDALMFVNATVPASHVNSTFTLQYGSGTATPPILDNSSASTIQAALNTTGVLPVGISATCAGGPLPADISISLFGFNTPAPSLISVATQSVAGGSLLIGQKPQPLSSGGFVWQPWTTTAATLDSIPYSQAFHGGQVYRFTAKPGGSPSASFGIGPFAPTPGTTRYTFSVYARAPVSTRPILVGITWTDVLNQTTGYSTITTSWNTSSSQWQRAILTDVVPVAASRQQISTGGTVTAGNFTLTYNSQTTANIPWNATAATVLSALQALTNVGTNGVGFATGGPLPGTPVYVTFLPNTARVTGNTVEGTAVGTPALMTANSTGLTGGTVSVIASPTVAASLQIAVPTASPAEIYYFDAIQFEVGDVVTAFAPKPDEVIANTITANMINVGLLSAISANLGTVTTGSLTSVSITSAVITAPVITGGILQTTTSDPKTAIDSTGFWTTNASGVKTVTLDHLHGLNLTGGNASPNSVTWNLNAATSNVWVALLFGSQNIVSGSIVNDLFLSASGPDSSSYYSAVSCQSSSSADIGGNGNFVKAECYNGSRTTFYSITLVDGVGNTTLSNLLCNTIGCGGNLVAGRLLGPVGTNGCMLTDTNGHQIEFTWTGTVLQWFVDGTAVNVASSSRFKHNVEPISGALDTIRALRGVSFDWKHRPFYSETRQRGLIVEEVASALPSAVEKQVHPNSNEEQFTLNELPIIATLVEAVKELASRVENLEAGAASKALSRLVTSNTFDEARDSVRNELIHHLESQHFDAVIKDEDPVHLESEIAVLKTRP